jgi:large subunit ribosomal protein L22
MANPTPLKLQRASATLKSHNQTPRKVRLVADLVKGKSVKAALEALQVLPRRAAEPVAKLISSAVANAKGKGEDVETLKVQSITVESAGMLKKYMPRAFGRASLIRRRKSRVKVTLT